MKPQKVFNHLDQSNEYRPEAMTTVNGPECQLNDRDLLNAFKRNLEMLRDDYLQLTESEARDQTKHSLNPVDPLHVDWVSRDALLSNYEANLKQ